MQKLIFCLFSQISIEFIWILFCFNYQNFIRWRSIKFLNIIKIFNTSQSRSNSTRYRFNIWFMVRKWELIEDTPSFGAQIYISSTHLAPSRIHYRRLKSPRHTHLPTSRFKICWLYPSMNFSGNGNPGNKIWYRPFLFLDLLET